MDYEWTERVFPPKECVIRKPPREDANVTVWNNIFIYGAIGTGKTELSYSLCKLAEERYKQLDVWMCYDLQEVLMATERSSKPFNIYILDDCTDIRPSKEDLHDFFRLRHIYSRSSGRRSGYLITILGFHRFWNIPIELRSSFNFLFLKSIPTNEFDKRFIERMFGKRLINEFSGLVSGRLYRPEVNSYTLFRDVEMDENMLLQIPMVEKPVKVKTPWEVPIKRRVSFASVSNEVKKEEELEDEEPEGAEHYLDDEEN